MKKLLLFLAGFLTAICSFFVLWRLNILHNSLLDAFTDRDKASVESISHITSPNGQYIATTNKVSDRTGWCELRINVHKKDESFDWEQDYTCITNCETQLEQKWQDDQHLDILYWSNDESKGVKTYQQFWSKDKAVQIFYTLKQ